MFRRRLRILPEGHSTWRRFDFGRVVGLWLFVFGAAMALIMLALLLASLANAAPAGMLVCDALGCRCDPTALAGVASCDDVVIGGGPAPFQRWFGVLDGPNAYPSITTVEPRCTVILPHLGSLPPIRSARFIIEGRGDIAAWLSERCEVIGQP